LYQLDEEEPNEVGLPAGSQVDGTPLAGEGQEIVLEEVSTKVTSEAEEKVDDVDDGYERPGPVDASTNEFEVEDIVGHVVVKGRYRYKVKWRGYPLEDDAPLPPQRLQAPEVRVLLREYMARNGITSLTAPGSRRRRRQL